MQKKTIICEEVQKPESPKNHDKPKITLKLKKPKQP